MKLVFLFPLLLASVISRPLHLLNKEERRRLKKRAEIDYGWITHHELMEHVHTLSRMSGAVSPRNIPGYCDVVAKRLRLHLIENSPVLIDHIVNLGHHFAGRSLSDRKPLKRDEMMPDVATRLRGAYRRKMKETPQFMRELVASSQIEVCENLVPTFDHTCPHVPCVKKYLDDSGRFAAYDGGDGGPAYGGKGGYQAAVASLTRGDNDSLMSWSGEPSDRTNANAYAFTLISLQISSITADVADAVCEGVDDSIDVCILCAIFELPNPGKIACHVINAILQIFVLSLDAVKTQMDFQDGLVQAAEIEASYESTKTLLHKQCAIFDEARCRCSTNLGFGSGCNGIDDDCNDIIDECREDVSPPTIDITNAREACSGWFSSMEEAINCVKETVIVDDDCKNVTVTVTAQTNNCGDSAVRVAAKEVKEVDPVTGAVTQLDCDAADINDASVIVPVKIDEAPPVPTCSFSSPTITTTGTSRPTDVGFTYGATDSCGGPLNVTVKIFANEIEDFSAQKMALFFQNGNENDAADLFLAIGICSTSSNGQCIKDPTASDARLYTAVVTASDESGKSNTDSCEIKVVPNGNLKKKDVDTSNTFQRFLLDSYSSVFTS